MLARYRAEKLRCTVQFERWYRYFQHVLDHRKGSNEPVVLDLRTWYAFEILITTIERYGPETKYDALMTDFEDVCLVGRTDCNQHTELGAREHVQLRYEIGYVAPVYFAATQCRGPFLRRRAIAVLRDYPRQESVLESFAASRLVTA